MSQAASTDHLAFPRGVLYAAGALLLFTLVVAGVARATGRNHVALAPTAVVSQRDLLFADRADGGVVITEAGTGRPVAVIAPETGGFLRGIMRGLVREHELAQGAAGSSFRLTRWADGRLSIGDPASGEQFELEAFGPTNEAAFAALLPGRPEREPAGARATARAGAETP